MTTNLLAMNHINLGDFFQLYKQLKPASVNLALSDLPFGLFDDGRLNGVPDSKIDLSRLEEAMDYLLTPTGQAVLFCDFDLLTRIKFQWGERIKYKHHHVLIKSAAMPGSKFYPLNDVEYLAVCHRTGSKISDLVFNSYNGDKREAYRKKNYDLDECKLRRQYKPKFNHNESGCRYIRTTIPMRSKCNLPEAERAGVDHPFQKSIQLLRKLIRIFSNPGEFICDGFAGSGSTLIAADMEGRKSVGFEIDDQYYFEALGRLERFKCAITLPF